MNKNENRHDSGSGDNFSEHSNKTKNNPKAPSNYLPAILAVVIILAFVALFGNTENSRATQSGSTENSGATQSNYNQQPQNQQPQKICRDVQVPYDYLEQYSETVPYTDRVCESKNLPYSTDGFVQMPKDECTATGCKDPILFGMICTNNFCTDRTVSCSSGVKNLDSEESGVFGITFRFSQVGTGSTIKTEYVSESIYPQTRKEVTATTKIQSSGVDGDANKDITCSGQITTVPTKQVCRDVTKYKEVTKTRTVTRYRTENKCE